ncbi:MAG: potassium channel protein [Desulfohalobiaceae bacterium]|nr:potassium channel protein [Desulfohalobiaceae bacterium]
MKHPAFTRRNRYTLILLVALFCLLLLGTGGYMLLEGVEPLRALYMTVVALTTVAGTSLSESGQLFTIVLVLLGFGLVAAAAAFLGNLLLEGNWIQLYKWRKVRKMLQNLQDHYIICGHGQMGQLVAEELIRHELAVVVLDNNESALLRCKELGVPHLQCDAMEEENLEAAGVERAKGLISVVDRDADNVFIVLTARSLNPDLFVCARAGSKGVEKKLIRAGVDKVVSPYASAAIRITQKVLRPSITDFLDLALSGEGFELEMEELRIPEGAPVAGQTLVDSNIRGEFNIIIITLLRPDGARIYNPSPRETLQSGDTLIAVGPRDNMDRFYEHLFNAPRVAPRKTLDTHGS